MPFKHETELQVENSRYTGHVIPRFCLCLLFLFALTASAQDSAKTHFIRASGEASISVRPDRAEITIGVSTHAVTAQSASASNAAQTSLVVEATKRALGAGGQVKTTGYSLNPQYDYQNGRPQHLNGYEATNSVILTIDDLSLVGKAIDAATQSGANHVNGISFSLRDSSAVRAQALAEAATRARANAEAMAKALGVRVLSLLEAEPTAVPPVRPLGRVMMAMEGNSATDRVATPIDAGDLDIRATVTVTLEVQ